MIDHRRTIEYQLIPHKPGKYKVYVPFTYFDPDEKRFITISSDTLVVKVMQGSRARSGVAADDEEDVIFDIQPVHTAILPDRFWRSWLHLLLFGLLVSGSCWGLMVSIKAEKEGRVSRTEKIRSAAAGHAVARLDELMSSSSGLESKVFYERATEIYYRFLCERLTIPPSELEEKRLPIYLQKAKVDEGIAQRVQKMYQACLPVRYGGAPAGYSREEMIAACKEIISGL